MNIIQLEYFLKLAELGNFRKTAEAFYITQPAISKQITLLEKEWGFPLFDRSYRSVKLTASGEIMLNMLRNSMDQYNEALVDAKRHSRRYASELRIGLPEYATIGNLSDLLVEFQKAHPDVIMNIQYVPMSYLNMTDPDNHFDLVVDYERNVRGKSGIESVTIGRRRHMAIVAADHPALKKSPPQFIDLKKERAFVPGRGDNHLTKDYLIFICNYHGFTPPEVERMPNIESVLMAIKMGYGYAVLDDLLDLPERFHLIQLPTACCFDVKLVWKRDNINPNLRKLVRFLVDETEIANTGISTRSNEIEIALS